MVENILQTAAVIIPVYLLILLGAWIHSRKEGLRNILEGTVLAFIIIAVIAAFVGLFLIWVYAGRWLAEAGHRPESIVLFIVPTVLLFYFGCLGDAGGDKVKALKYLLTWVLFITAAGGLVTILANIWS